LADEIHWPSAGLYLGVAIVVFSVGLVEGLDNLFNQVGLATDVFAVGLTVLFLSPAY